MYKIYILEDFFIHKDLLTFLYNMQYTELYFTITFFEGMLYENRN